MAVYFYPPVTFGGLEQKEVVTPGIDPILLSHKEV